MANRRGGGSSGFKNFVSSVVVLVIITSSLMGWAKVNDINSVPAGYEYFKAWSDKLWNCGAGEAKLECEESSAPTDGGSNPSEGGSNPGGQNPSQGQKPDSSNPGGDESNSTPPVKEDSKNSSDTKMNDLDTLAALTVADEKTVDYERSEWKHWIGTPCDTRETILIEQGKDVKSDPSTCKVTSGTWVDPYGGDTITVAGDLDIDHVIPLGYVAKHGGQDWSVEKKQQFANDKTQLVAASAKENRSKSDKGPESWMPPEREFHCEYSKIWVSTATKYGISVTEGDKRALKAGLQKC